MRRHAFVVLALFILATLLACESRFINKTQPYGTTYVYPDHFPGQTLQQAIWNDKVEDGDKVFVMNGTWLANLVVNKSIALEGRTRNDTILKGSITIKAPNVSILQFTITNATTGISVFEADNCEISLNRIMNNQVGVDILRSSDCSLRDNQIGNNGYDFKISGSMLDHYVHDIDASNTINGKPIYYWVNKTAGSIPSDAGFAAIVNSTDIIVENLTSLSSNYAGVLVAYSSRIVLRDFQCRNPYVNFDRVIEFKNVESSVIQNVTLTCNTLTALVLDEARNNSIIDNVITADFGRLGGGIVMLNSSGNQVIANNVSRAYFLIGLEHSDGNMFSRNNFVDYNNRLLVSSSYNTFDNGYEGNYWSDYRDKYPNATEVDGTGIWDTPYASTNSPDNYPLVSNWTANRAFKRPMTSEPYPKSTQKLNAYSNSTLGNLPLGFSFNRTTAQISLKATTGYPAFLNITIPRNWIDGPFNVTVNGEPMQFSVEANATHSCISITYPQGRYTIQVKGTEVGSIQGDLNNDGEVNVLDAIILGNNFGSKE